MLQLGSLAASIFALSPHSLSSASILDVPLGKGAGWSQVVETTVVPLFMD